MSLLAYVFLGIYATCLLYITLYCVMQFDLLVFYKRGLKKESGHGPAGELSPGIPPDYEWPMVTVQLPLYNEMYVVERLIDAIAAFDYPRDLLEIHILDDSTDETRDLVASKVAEYRAKGFRIEQILRPDRTGYKAGALREATPLASGEFLAIFDADFLPKPDFLRKTIPWFRDPEIGVVQTRWEHINQDYSLITRLQALQLNVHFTVEQVGRMQGDYFLQFNGTAGVWRKSTIVDAGGWEADTLTEDLDLSIRAQMKGWKIKFLENIGSPAELPAEMNALKSQQFRWMKGGAETARKMVQKLWQSETLSARQKIHATQHLFASSVFLFVFVTGLSSVPLLYYMEQFIERGFNKDVFTYFFLGMLSVTSVYFVANIQSPARKKPTADAIVEFFLLFPLFLSLSMGLSLHNTVAVIEGYMGKKSAFVRTPKFNIQDVGDSFFKNRYIIRKLAPSTIGEGLLALYYLGGIALGIHLGLYIFVVFHCMLAFGFGAIFFFTARHSLIRG